MAHGELKKQVWRANMDLVQAGLVVLTWGNASGVDRSAGVMAIKPSGVAYERMSPADIVILDLETGGVVDGKLRPSSDAPTHLMIYRAFAPVGGIVHTHSSYATSWAQAHREIPCLGTTHADAFYGAVPLTRGLTAEEVDDDYEANTGKVIVERFAAKDIDPVSTPAALVPGHGPFAWGQSTQEAVWHAVALEETARMAWQTIALRPGTAPLSDYLLEKHFHRKHGPGAYYGQQA